MTRKLIIGSMIVAVCVAFAAVVDMVAGKPFGNQFMLDVPLLISAGIVGYMGFDAYRDLA